MSGSRLCVRFGTITAVVTARRGPRWWPAHAPNDWAVLSQGPGEHNACRALLAVAQTLGEIGERRVASVIFRRRLIDRIGLRARVRRAGVRINRQAQQLGDHFAQIDNPIDHRFSLGRIGIEVQGIGDRVDPVVENLIDGLVDNNLKIIARDNTGLSDPRPHTAGDLDPAGDTANKRQVSCRVGDGDDVETRGERGANRWRERQGQLVAAG